MFKSFQITTAYGIPIRIHWTLYFAGPIWLISNFQGLGGLLLGVILIVGLMFSVALHEVGHSILALRKNIGVSDIVLTPIGGIASLTAMPEESGDEMQIAIAGPLVSVALALGFGLLAWLMGFWGDQFMFTAMLYIALMNMMLALFNMIPAFPMDGGRIFRAWLTPRKGRIQATRIAAEIGKYLAIMGGIYGLFGNGGFPLVLIAIFIYMAAGSEYRMVLMQERVNQMQNPFGTGQAASAEGFSVSPPPYERGPSRVLKSGLLRETFEAYKILQAEFFSYLRRSFSSQ